MEKAVLKILLTFAILSVICCAFWQLRWLTSASEAAILFAITGGVIAIDFAWTFLRKSIRNRT
ncbi:hypothetical protein [Dysosmobacter sp.]|uniref:hypothetical protein n=1 Tax=Dysosmobacter sp. TaxID=2591382 RepID=UPI003AB19EA5